VADAAKAALQSEQARIAGVIIEGLVGALLIAFAIWRSRSPKTSTGPRIGAWQARALDPEEPLRPLLLLAVTAVAIEAVSMLPYIGAIALVSRAELPLPAATAAIAAYCLLMVLPAVVLTVLRRAGSARMDPLLTRISAWSSKGTGSPAILWAAGLVGAALVVDTALRA
jgi:Sap, sulfolipid-1-addressing protein